MCLQILVNPPVIKFHENPFSRSRIVSCEQTDRLADRADNEVSMRIFAIFSYECAKKILCMSILFS
jgi:hypothetical protein